MIVFEDWRVIASVLLMAWPVTSAHADAASVLCNIPEAEIARSTQCVRWYFVCNRLGPPPPGAQNIPYQKRLELLAEMNFKLAERNCAFFDYQAAKAAMDAASR